MESTRACSSLFAFTPQHYLHEGFNGKLDEMEVAKYLLKNGEVLKKMTIYTHDPLRPKSCTRNCQPVKGVQRLVKLKLFEMP